MFEADTEPQWETGASDADVLTRQINQLAQDSESKGLPFLATALRNLTSLIDAEYRVAQGLHQQTVH